METPLVSKGFQAFCSSGSASIPVYFFASGDCPDSTELASCRTLGHRGFGAVELWVADGTSVVTQKTNGGSSPEPDQAMAALTRIVLADHTLAGVLSQVCEIARETVPGAVEVSVTLLERKPITAAFSGPLATVLDESQYAAGHGPCLSAATTGDCFVIDDARTELRWPDYTSRAVAAGALSCLSIPLPVNSTIIGALNIYGREASAFDDRSQKIAEDLAAYAGIVLNNAQHYFEATAAADQMREAMASRSVIEQAKGILMGARRCGEEESFDILVRLSQQSHRKLRDVAKAIVDRATGDDAPLL